jgi:hypothetical protein
MLIVHLFSLGYLARVRLDMGVLRAAAAACLLALWPMGTRW